MRRHGVGILALGCLAVCVWSAMSQQPGRPGKGPSRRPGGPPPGPFEPGRVLPPPIREQLDLTPEQETQLSELEKEVRERLLKLLTPEQRAKLREFPQRGPEGPPPGRPPLREGRDGGPEAAASTPPNGIAWFATWESGLREAQRTGRPILLLSAAPHCAGVSGIW